MKKNTAKTIALGSIIGLLPAVTYASMGCGSPYSLLERSYFVISALMALGGFVFFYLVVALFRKLTNDDKTRRKMLVMGSLFFGVTLGLSSFIAAPAAQIIDRLIWDVTPFSVTQELDALIHAEVVVFVLLMFIVSLVFAFATIPTSFKSKKSWRLSFSFGWILVPLIALVLFAPLRLLIDKVFAQSLAFPIVDQYTTVCPPEPVLDNILQLGIIILAIVLLVLNGNLLRNYLKKNA